MAFLDETGLAHVRELVREDIEAATAELDLQAHTHENKAVLDEITEQKVSTWDKSMSLKNAVAKLPEIYPLDILIYGNGKYLALEYSPSNYLHTGVIIYSADGIIWEKTEAAPMVKIAYGNGMFVGKCLESNAVSYSADGITWEKTELPDNDFGSYQGWRLIGFFGDKFFMYDNNSITRLIYSTDGITWKEITIPIAIKNIAYGNGTFIGMAYNATSVAYSTDGITWEQIELPENNNNWGNVGFYGDRFFIAHAAYGAGAMLYSTDGITWKETTSPFDVSYIAYGNGVFVMTDNNSSIAYSTDGITWEQIESPEIDYINTVVYGNGIFLVSPAESYANSYGLLYSTDGMNWERVLSDDISCGSLLIYNDDKFVNVSNTKAAYSTDGIHWLTEIKAIEDASGADITDSVRDVLGILQAVYPVGALYLSSVDADPATLFGFGTWERVKDTFLLAAGDTYAAGATGGEETHSHKYGIQYGGYYRQAVFENNENAGALIYDKAGNITISQDKTVLEGGVDVNSSTLQDTAHYDPSNFYRTVGQASYESNLPPYLAVYVWKRTA